MSSFFSMNMIYAILCFISGHVLGWYATNLQFVSEYWKDRVLLSILLFGVPCSILFWYGTKFCMEASGELWTSRFVAAVFSYLTFPLMTWWYLGESMFTLKTMSCVFLAFCILMIQIFVK